MAANTLDHKDNVGEHIEHASIHSDVDVEKKATVHATINGHEIDEETAKYLDPTVVIDEATNKRIKAMVRTLKNGANCSLTAAFSLSWS